MKYARLPVSDQYNMQHHIIGDDLPLTGCGRKKSWAMAVTFLSTCAVAMISGRSCKTREPVGMCGCLARTWEISIPVLPPTSTTNGEPPSSLAPASSLLVSTTLVHGVFHVVHASMCPVNASKQAGLFCNRLKKFRPSGSAAEWLFVVTSFGSWYDMFARYVGKLLLVAIYWFVLRREGSV